MNFEGVEELGRWLTIAHLGTDARFPNMNQTKHCWQNYVDYHKCIIAKGEDFAPCRQVGAAGLAGTIPELTRCQFWLAYRSLCPSSWHKRWDEQRGMCPSKERYPFHSTNGSPEYGNFPVKLDQ